MIKSRVYNLQATVNVTLRLPNASDLAMEFVIDTGFEGALTLPPAAVATLGLTFFQDINANLADDSTVRVAVYIVRIVWDGIEQEVPVLATGRRPLLGTELLNHMRLCIDFEDSGEVVIDNPL